jgi:Mrp family chromosome partitioning ATPase
MSERSLALDSTASPLLTNDGKSRTLRPEEIAALRRQEWETASQFSEDAGWDEMTEVTAENFPFETAVTMERPGSKRAEKTLPPEEFAPVAAPGEMTKPAAPLINLRIEKTPQEFSHLYASLERQIAGVGDVTLISGETLGAERPYVLGITSAVAGEGKTTVALHLAMTIARDTFKRVCLIDMSLGKGDLATRIGVPARGEGVVPVLEDNDNVVPTLQLAGCENLVIIPAGKVPSNASRLARSPRVAQLIVSARMAFDVVIVDMPAVVSDNALPLTRHMDGLLVVTRAGATPREVVVQALDALGRDKVIGVTLNRIKTSGPAWLRRRIAKA